MVQAGKEREDRMARTKEKDRSVGAGQLRLDTVAAMTVKLGHYIWDMTSAMTLDRITQTDQSGQVGLTGQPGQLKNSEKTATKKRPTSI